MTHRDLRSALAALMLSVAIPSFTPAHAQTRDASLLPPEQSGVITVAGCLQLGGKHGDKYVLASPKLGPVENVPDGRCDAIADDRTLEVKHTGHQGMNQSMIGHWIEINGRLEKETSADLSNLRELYVRSFRLVPVVPARAEAAPTARYEPPPVVPSAEQPAPVESPKPIATSGVAEPTLPKTASPLPAIGLFGLFSLAAALGLRLARS